MTTATQDYSQLVGKRVILQVNGDATDEVIDLKGKLEAANALGVLVKPKGRSNSILYEAEQIVSLEADEDATLSSKGNYKLKQRRMSPVTESSVRRHLLDGHGVQLSWVNSVTGEQAFQAHEQMHDGDQSSEIGHYHAPKGATKA